MIFALRNLESKNLKYEFIRSFKLALRSKKNEW